MTDIQSSPGYAPRGALNDAFNNNQRMVKAYDNLQSLVLNNPFINAGEPVASTSIADTSVPVIFNGTIYYLKLSTNP